MSGKPLTGMGIGVFNRQTNRFKHDADGLEYYVHEGVSKRRMKYYEDEGGGWRGTTPKYETYTMPCFRIFHPETLTPVGTITSIGKNYGRRIWKLNWYQNYQNIGWAYDPTTNTLTNKNKNDGIQS